MCVIELCYKLQKGRNFDKCCYLKTNYSAILLLDFLCKTIYNN